MSRYILIRRLRGPAFLLLVGVIALLAQADILSWGRSWPLFLILAGVLQLAERAAMASEGDMPPVPYPGAPYPGSPYPGSPYPGAPYAAAADATQPTQRGPFDGPSQPQPGTGLVPTTPLPLVKSGDDDEGGRQ
jgi:hypothetical protein